MSRLKIITVFISIFMGLICCDSPLFAGNQELMMKQLTSQEVSQSNESAPIVRPVLQYSADNLRDPFQEYKEKKVVVESKPQEEQKEEAPTTPPSLDIQGVIWGGEIPQAIINGKIVKVGNTIDEAEIIKIDKQGVTVLYKGSQFILSSPGIKNLESIKKK